VAKTTTPGIHQVRRFLHGGMFEGDMIYDVNHPPVVTEQIIVDPLDHTRRKQFSSDAIYEDLLIPVVRSGKICYRGPEISKIKERVKKDLDRLHPTILRLVNPHQFPVGIEQELHELKSRMVLEMRGFTANDEIERSGL
jgi:nicotinate phosphoribosyltransferase